MLGVVVVLMMMRIAGRGIGRTGEEEELGASCTKKKRG